MLVAADLQDASRLMTIFDPNEDGVVDQQEQKRLPWKDEGLDFDMNKDGQLSHLEVAVRFAKLRDDDDITQFDINSVNTFLRRHDNNRNGQLEPDKIASGGWPTNPEDYDKNGRVTIAEVEKMVAEVRKQRGYTEKEFNKAKTMLTRHDLNRNKYIEESELFENPRPGQLPKDLIQQADLNEDGKVGLDEMARYFARQESK